MLAKEKHSDATEQILAEIGSYFGGKVPKFFRAFAEVDESLLRAKWADYKRTLFEGSSSLSQELKYMMMYQVVKGHSQCASCLNIHTGMMNELGIPAELIRDLQKDIAKSNLLDERRKNILVFTYHASAAPRGALDPKVFEVFLRLIGVKELTEIAALISTCKALQDFIHIRQIEH